MGTSWQVTLTLNADYFVNKTSGFFDVILNVFFEQQQLLLYDLVEPIFIQFRAKYWDSDYDACYY